MAPQLQLNQGPQDALLYDNSRSYFTNVGYTRTSNFQMELRDVDPQNTPNLGATVNFVIPKAADLLGPCDLMIEFNKSTAAPGSNKAWGWVESVGHAMLEKITFSVGSHDVEVLTGEHLNIINELMRTDEHRYGFKKTLKTGRPLVRSNLAGTTHGRVLESDTKYDAYDRLIAYDTATIKDGKKLVIPLGLFFMKHPSAYFPLAAIAGCNDVRISIKFRNVQELVMGHSVYSVTGGTADDTEPTNAFETPLAFEGSSVLKRCQLRCHYVHLTGPEATQLMNREHVRLMKLWNGNEVSKQFAVSATAADKTAKFDLDLSFLHPVQEIVITIRKVSEMGSSTITTAKPTDASQGARTKNYFAYHGGGRDPNPDSPANSTITGSLPSGSTAPYLTVRNFKLTLNGQSRHLDGQGIDRDYLMDRLMPMLHSNADELNTEIAVSSLAKHDANKVFNDDFAALRELQDRKEIYVYPFALNPEGHNPSGAVNFSKVSHAKLSIEYEADGDSEYQVDVYGLYYNWLAIKDGRALTSFA